MLAKREKIYFEYLRIIACGLVIFNHLEANSLYAISSGWVKYLYMGLTMFVRINVPIFLMISGALLLGKTEDYKQVLQKRIVRIVLTLVIFSGGLYILSYIRSLKNGVPCEFSIINFISCVFSRKIEFTEPYWYLYAYLGFLCLLPFMQRIAQKFNKFDFYVLLFFHFIFSSFIPLLNVLLAALKMDSFSISSDFAVPLATLKAFFYPLIGYYLDTQIHIKKVNIKHIFGLILLSMFGIIISCCCTQYEFNIIGTYTNNYVQLFDYVTAITILLSFKYLIVVSNPNLGKGVMAKVITKIGALTFGIYLFDVYFKVLFYQYYYHIASLYLPTLMSSLIWIIISMFVGGVTTYLLKKKTFFKNLL